MSNVSGLVELRDAMRTFTAERGWERYHDPKSLLLALVGEVGELSELFQWLPADDAISSVADEPSLRIHVGDEMADVLLYLVRLADVLEIDLHHVATRKVAINARKYPVSRSD